MFDKIEYSDLYKFLTSIGLILIGVSLLLPWLFLKQEYNLNLSIREFNELTLESRTLYLDKVYYINQVILFLPWVSGSILISGIWSFFYGLKNWFRNQNILDTTNELNLIKLQAEIQPLNFKEVQDKAQKEVDSEMESKDAEFSEKNSQVVESSDVLNEIKTHQSLKLLDIESSIFQRLIQYNTFEYKVQQNMKLANKYEVDIMLTSFNSSKIPDKLIQIKYFQNQLSMQIVRDTTNDLKRAYNYYIAATKRNATAKVILIYKTGIANEEQMQRFKAALNSLREDYQNIPLSIGLFDDQSASTMGIKELIL